MVPVLTSGRLPLGRWPATPAEIEAAYVVGRSDRRQEIWSHWLQLTAAMRETVTCLPAAWISGSFLTHKDEPSDIDCVYIVEAPVLLGAKVDPRKAQFLQVVASNRVKDVFRLSVDSFILEWVPSTVGVRKPEWAQDYLRDRGYWDDLWSREKSPDPREARRP